MPLIFLESYIQIKDFFPDGVLAGFTNTRIKGNLPGDIERLVSLLGKGLCFAYLKQTHSAQICEIVKDGLYLGDGLITTKGRLLLVVRTADCLPIFLARKDAGIIGMLHMGWRGAKEGILESLDLDLSRFKVVAGVGLRSCCYEVGEEFLDYPNFKEFLKEKKAKLYFDPISFVKNSFFKKGLKEENFLDLGICSFCSPFKFYSARREREDLRTLSFVVRIA